MRIYQKVSMISYIFKKATGSEFKMVDEQIDKSGSENFVYIASGRRSAILRATNYALRELPDPFSDR